MASNYIPQEEEEGGCGYCKLHPSMFGPAPNPEAQCNESYERLYRLVEACRKRGDNWGDDLQPDCPRTCAESFDYILKESSVMTKAKFMAMEI